MTEQAYGLGVAYSSTYGSDGLASSPYLPPPDAAGLADGATGHRRILEEYDPYLLDQMIAIVAAATLVVYIIYCASPETAEKFGTRWLVLTTPFPIYGIFRYLYLVHLKEAGGSPADTLLNDRPLLACVALWAMTVTLIIYWARI